MQDETDRYFHMGSTWTWLSIYFIFKYWNVARWSRGMILALGARGPGFKSRTSPIFYILIEKNWKTFLDSFANFVQSIVHKKTLYNAHLWNKSRKISGLLSQNWMRGRIGVKVTFSVSDEYCQSSDFLVKWL